jgi:hypothetical protein
MPPHMVRLAPFLTSSATVRRLPISLPMVEPLLDGVRYFRPDDLPPLTGDELRLTSRPRMNRAPALARIGGCAP